MTLILGRRRVSDPEFRACVAQALLHLGDVAWLADSPLVTLPPVQERITDSRKLFAEGYALREQVTETAQAVARELEERGKLGLVRATLTGVCAGKSVACVAREHGKTREHFSRTYWSLAVALAADRLAALPDRKRRPYTGRRVRESDTLPSAFPPVSAGRQ